MCFCCYHFTGITTLRVLNIGRNEIGDEGAAILSKEIQNKNLITELSVAVCRLSVRGTYISSQVKCVYFCKCE